jgi:dihydrodipicolinate synthase/N-acetylneuraminate lyase
VDSEVRAILQKGVVIPASPLALNSRRHLDERRQKALWRYYSAAGAGGIAIGVHTTQFAIRDPKTALFEPLLELAAEELTSLDSERRQKIVRVGGICGKTSQAIREAELLRRHGFHAGLLSLGALASASETELLNHCEQVAKILPIIGFYLQPAAGGRLLPYSFWRRLLEIENLLAIKIAPFNRYQTIDVIRAVVESSRTDVALYTGNDDNIVVDLVTPWRFHVNGKFVERRIVGGLLGHWSVWTKKAAELLAKCQELTSQNKAIPAEILSLAVQITDANAALFDAANNYAGCIPGLHEVLRRQGLLEGIWCVDPAEGLSPGQQKEIDRVYAAYPYLNDDTFVEEHLDQWLK